MELKVREGVGKGNHRLNSLPNTQGGEEKGSQARVGVEKGNTQPYLLA